MITVIGVRFKKAGKVYYFDPNNVWPRPGESVVVETTRGLELGEVVTGAREVTDDQIVAPLKKVVRAALAEDIQRAEFNAKREKEAVPICQERITAHKLDMKLVDVEYTFDNSKIIFYFTADNRVDFRELVKDLASIFHMRIELRQIGVRDEAKMIGGLGICGRPICCAAFLGDFQPLSIRMAKEQNLSLNPVKISGQCGRLMCCLKYEQEYYEQTMKKVPRVGNEVLTPDGPGIVNEVRVIRETVRVRIRNADDTYDMREYAISEIAKPGHPLPVKAQPEEEEPFAALKPDSAQQAAPDAAQEEAPQPPREQRRSPRNRSGFKTKKAEQKPGETSDTQVVDVPVPAEIIAPDEVEEDDLPVDEPAGSGPKRRKRRGGRNRRKPANPAPSPSPTE